MIRAAALALALAASPVAAMPDPEQVPETVELCKLIANGADYSDRVVIVEGRIVRHGEYHFLESYGCPFGLALSDSPQGRDLAGLGRWPHNLTVSGRVRLMPSPVNDPGPPIVILDAMRVLGMSHW